MELGVSQNNPSVIYEDNNSCVAIASSFKQNPGVKHIDMAYHFIRDRILTQKDIVVVRKSTGEMVADLFTKQLSTQLFWKHRARLGMRVD
jgi:hypothetical protein